MAIYEATRAHAAVTPSSATIAAAASQTADCDLRTPGYPTADIQVAITAPASRTGNITLEFFSSPTGATSGLDTIAFLTRTIAYAAETGTKSYTLRGVGAGLVRVKATNGTAGDVTWAITMEGVTQTST